ncbi:hypothetical protein LTR09_001273 [Extremus antarcticus]|uniref:VOC domain-containing protein n=1 Tax=Extremus antarcticus TaxID=702011 RepID=A0AAJ0GIL9_9PEZI|nr:hypothetical protein LTR09_001273 [Extremus antarcticus]
MATNGNTDKILSPTELCHVVLKTTPENLQKMVSFYTTFLGAKVISSNERISFLIVAFPGITNLDSSKSVGLAHVSFGFDTLDDLATSYEQKRDHGIKPTWSVNHGMTTSMYYADPDGNGVETQVDNLDKAQAMEFIQSESFSTNPIGVDYDPEEFVRRVRRGDDQAMLKKRPDIGARGHPGENNVKVMSVE